MCLCLLRRSLLRTALVSSALVACQPVAPEPKAVSERRRWLDVHCHVFNARDVPLFEFISRTRLRTGAAGIAAPVLALLAGGIRHDAMTPAEELASLSSREGPLETSPEATDPVSALLQLRDDALEGPGSRGRRTTAPPRAGGAPTGSKALQFFDDALHDAGIRTGAKTPHKAPTDSELKFFAEMIDPNSRSALGTLGRYFQWGTMFSESRNALTGRLTALYDGQETMLTPAMVDYDLWLEAPDDGLPAQVTVMEAIGARRAAEGVPVHAFVAFDPWRCLHDRNIGRDTLAELKTVMARGGGIGIKLYPPMGFGAAGNSKRPASDFPPALLRLTRGRPGEALDGVMDELFDYATDFGIPVMAHCGATNSSKAGYEQYASPAFWREALERPGKPRRRELRLNLGHFGGIWEMGSGNDQQRGWARQVVELMGRFPNVYADIAYFGSVLEPGSEATVAQTADFIGGLADGPGSVLRQRLMYGSDWSMIGQEEGPSSYPSKVMQALSPVWPGLAGEDLRWRNASRFLGLGANEGTRARLASFYAAHSLNPAPLLRFDPAT